MKIIDYYLESLIGYDKDVIKETNVAGAVILRVNEEGTKSVLLIKRSHDDHWPNIWEFPRGGVRPKEKILQGLKREVREETGLDIDVIEYIDKYEYLADKGRRKSTQYNYLCKMIDQKQKVKLSKEHEEYKWTQSFGQVELLIPAEMKKTVSKVLNNEDQIINYPKTKEVIEETQKRWLN